MASKDFQRVLYREGLQGAFVPLNGYRRKKRIVNCLLRSSARIDRIELHKMARLDGVAIIAGLDVAYRVLEEVPKSQLLGGAILQNFVLTLDQKNRRVAFDPIAGDFLPARDHSEWGVGFRPTSKGLEVIRVFDGTPAKAAGIRQGDLITHFSGREVTKRGCVDDARDDAKMVLSIERDGVRRDLTLDMIPNFPAATQGNGD